MDAATAEQRAAVDQLTAVALQKAEEAAQALAELSALRSHCQGFFANLATEARRPHFGDQQRGWLQSFLLRAQEAGLFDPTKEPA